MDIIIIVVGWIAAGLAGSWVSAEFFHRRGAYPLPIRVSDLPFFIGVAVIFGPLNLIVGALFFLGWVIRRGLKRLGYNGKRVLLPAKDNGER